MVSNSLGFWCTRNTFFILNGIESVGADGEDVFYWFAATFRAMAIVLFDDILQEFFISNIFTPL